MKLDRWTRVVLAGGLFLVASGCSTEDILVARVHRDAGDDGLQEADSGESDEPDQPDDATSEIRPAEGDGGDLGDDASDETRFDGGGMGGQRDPRMPCFDSTSCEVSEYCSKRTCDDPVGRCERRPTFCDATPGVTCGCDGVNYFNNCLRKANGIPSATPGECDVTAVRCGTKFPPCPGDAYCAKLLPSGPICPLDPTGFCWVLPSVCGSDEPGGDRWTPCPGPPGGPCVGTCSAIRAERPFARNPRCGP